MAAAAAIALPWEARLANTQAALLAAREDLEACEAHQEGLDAQAALAASAAAAAAADASTVGAAVFLRSPLLEQAP